MDERDARIILALAENNMNVAQTANSLFMHRNTVLYHIMKIYKTTGLDATKFYDLCELVKKVKK